MIGLYRLSYLHRALKRTGLTGIETSQDRARPVVVVTPVEMFRWTDAIRWLDGRSRRIACPAVRGPCEGPRRRLLSLVPHGSWALGDFSPGRSDLDVLAVLATDPTAVMVAALHEVHERLATDFPEWDGHVEVEYVSVEAVRAVVQGTDESHPMISVGGGEPFHEVEVSRHYVLNWAAALQADRPIAGAAPSTVLPAIDRRLLHQVVLQHVRAWPSWMHDIEHPGAGDQAYTVLTLCRGAKRWRPDVRCPSSRLPAPAWQGPRSGPPLSTGPESGGTTVDPT